MQKLIVRGLLIGLAATGLWSSGRLAFKQFQTGDACPVLGDAIPACYIALFAYILIAAGVASLYIGSAQRMISISRSLFWTGTAIAGGLAALASVLELIKGDVCPVAFGFVPMCYISLGFSVAIALLYMVEANQAKQFGNEKTAE